MKILLLGKNGQLGWELQRSLAPLGELIALDRHSQDRPWRSRRTRAFTIWRPAVKPPGMGMQNT
jgi:dTDP-4-dehydrorhamnose reductase